MGDWYVIAHIPSWPEREAFDAVESYALKPDGRIQTTFTYRKGSFDAPQKSMHPIGRVEKEGNGAIWGMQFIWPIQAEYVIAWLAMTTARPSSRAASATTSGTWHARHRCPRATTSRPCSASRPWVTTPQAEARAAVGALSHRSSPRSTC
jgi:lipocalin